MIRICVGLMLLFVSLVVQASEIVDIPTEHGIPTRVLFSAPDTTKATVLLFIGGGGRVRIGDDGRTDQAHTFVRSFGLWHAFGVQAVLIDSPFDLGNALKGHKRAAKEHLDRVSDVIRHFHSKSDRPIWIFGHSMGTSTVAAFLSSNKPEVPLLRGYIVAGTHKGESIPATIKLPVLGIHHKREACPSTPISATEVIVKSRTSDTPSALVLLDGGNDQGDRCQAMAYHGFNGIEPELIKTAAEFILEH